MLKTPFLLLLALAGCLLQSAVQAQQQQQQQRERKFPQCECADLSLMGQPICATFNINFFDEAAMRCFNQCHKADLKVVHYGQCIGPIQPPPRSNSGRPMSG